MSDPVTSSSIKAALRLAFPAPGFQVFFEVGNDTGTRVTRHADAVALGIWPSTGHVVHGFEIKVSRGDFLREMKDPGKSLPVYRHCHHWSLAVPAGLVEPKEIPPGWGLYEVRDGKARVRVKPDRLEPAAMTPGFVAALVRRAGELDASMVAAEVTKVETKWRGKLETEVQSRVNRELAGRQSRAARLLEVVSKIEAVSGLKIEEWSDAEQIGKAVRAVVASGVDASYGGLGDILRTLRQSADRIEKALSAADSHAGAE